MSQPDDDRSRLERIEADLAASDPQFATRMRAAANLLPAHRLRAATQALLGLAGFSLLALGAARGAAALLAAGVVLVAAAALFTTLRRRASPRERRLGRRQHPVRAASTALAATRGTPPNADPLDVDLRASVVVGTDGSAGSEPALRYAAGEARRRHLSLVVVIAFSEPVDPDLDEFDTPPHVLRDQARERARHAFDRAVPDPPPHHVVAAAGLPGRVLADRFADAALIVIGARRRHLLAPLTALDSTEHLVVRGRAPVVVVPPTWTG